MSDRMEALRAKFRASLSDRADKLTAPLTALASGRGTAGDVQKIARALHAMKGDAGVVGMPDLVERLHALEEALAAARSAEPEVAPDLFARLGEDIAAVTRPTSSTPPSDDLPTPTLETRETYTRVETSLLDAISDRVLVLSDSFARVAARMNGAADSLRRAGLSEVVDEVDRTRAQLDDLMNLAWTLRLSSIERMLRVLARHAEDLASARHKPLRVVVEAGGEIERSVLDGLAEPIVHLVRNAVDHGVEPQGERHGKPPIATLTLAAETVGGNVQMTVRDDGRGLDLGRIRREAVARGFTTLEEAPRLSERAVLDLLFRHGFSTSEKTSDLSGRGVGLDIVRRRIEGLGGSVALTVPPGGGTCFTLIVPTSISRERAVVVEHADVLYAFSSHAVVALLRLEDYPLEEVAGGRALRWEGTALPFHSLSSVLDLGGSEDSAALIVTSEDRRVALGVSRLMAEHELLRRPADALVAAAGIIVASAMLDDGRCVLVPSIPALFRRIDAGQARGPRRGASPAATPTRVLVVDDSAIVRDLVVSILDALGYETEQCADGGAAIESIEAEPPDLVICDVEMPVMDGFEVLKRARARWPQLPFVMLTTRGAPEDRRLAVTLGANAYLVKSEFEQTRLVETVRRLAGARR
jgi:two-component system, chemotaxis family, sensor kinase CheA